MILTGSDGVRFYVTPLTGRVVVLKGEGPKKKPPAQWVRKAVRGPR